MYNSSSRLDRARVQFNKQATVNQLQATHACANPNSPDISSAFRAPVPESNVKLSAMSGTTPTKAGHLVSGHQSGEANSESKASANNGDPAAHCTEPKVKPNDPRFSSGPCRKHPGWSLETLNTDHLGCSHRASGPKDRLATAIDRSAKLLNLPDDWKLGIMPGSDTGAFEAAMWSLLGVKPVEVLVWESFSSDWATDLGSLGLNELVEHRVDYGELPELSRINTTDNDVVFVYNGTTSGVCMPDLSWISEHREGLILCDATSAAFAMPLDFDKLDVVTWSWQKVLGGEAAHGMLALSPRAVERLESHDAMRPLPKVFRLTKGGKLNEGIFKGATINTPSMLAVEDLHSALDWAESIGGASALEKRTEMNFQVIDSWVKETAWIDWLASDPQTRSRTSMCLKIVDPSFVALPDQSKKEVTAKIITVLRDKNIAFDIGSYRTAPAGFRLWGGPTIDTDEFIKLVPWIDWAYQQTMSSGPTQKIENGELSNG